MFRVDTAAQEGGRKKSLRVYEQTQSDPTTQPNSLNANFQLTTAPPANWPLFQNSLIFIYLNLGYR